MFILRALAVLFWLLFTALSLQAENTYYFGSYQPIGLSYKGNFSVALSSSFPQELYKVNAGYAFNKFLYLQTAYEKSFLKFDESKSQITNSSFAYAALGAYYFKGTPKTKKWLFKKLPEKYASIPGFLFDAALSYGWNENHSRYVFELYKSESEINLSKYAAIANVYYFGRWWGASLSFSTAILNFEKGKVNITGPSDLINFFNALEGTSRPTTFGTNLNVWLGIKQLKLMYSLNRDYAYRDRYYYYYFQRFASRLTLWLKFDIKKKPTGVPEAIELQ